MPNATVTLINVNTNVSQNTVTTGQDVYHFALVAPGTYKLIVHAAGFQTQQRIGILVTARQPTAADVELQLATAIESIEVSGQGAVIDDCKWQATPKPAVVVLKRLKRR
jgi:Carboxypeptidase regulatory-like domain